MLFIGEILLWIFSLYSLLKLALRKLAKPNYTDKVVWITGASSGIGEYLAYEFSSHNAELILSARNTKQLQRVKAACKNPSKIRVVQLDMSDFNQVEKITTKILLNLTTQKKRLDVVVENAGVSMRCQFEDYDFKNHLSMFDVNVNGPYKHLQCILPHMMKNQSGHIVGITSIQAKLGTAYRSSYAGSKHDFMGILDSIRTQVAEKNIKVTNILPGYIKTNISQNAFGAKAGQKFGETDKNIDKGMDPRCFAKEAVLAIYRGEKEAAIYKGIHIMLGIQLRNLCPDLSFFGLLLNVKNQSKTIKKQ